MKLIKKLALVCATVACFAAMGCSDSDELGTDTQFTNLSEAAVVTVTPSSNEIFSKFILNPGESHTVDRIGEHINYKYTSTKKVSVVNAEEVEVIFSDDLSNL